MIPVRWCELGNTTNYTESRALDVAFLHAVCVSDERDIRNLAIVGFMGTGKSTVGRKVAHGLQFEYVDTDALIEEQTGMRISEVFAQAGEPAFRKMERAVVESFASCENHVIATGGGLIVDSENRESLRRHAMLVCLWASPGAILRRTQHNTHRPLLQDSDPKARIAELLTEREPHYRQADIIINTELRPIREVVQQVIHQFRETNTGDT